MILRNARLIFPDGIREGLEVVVRDGVIAVVRETTSAAGEEVLDLNGNFLAPGFIDLHLHGALGRDAMEATEDAFREICDFHASGGTTSLLLTTVTAPIAQIVRSLAAIREFRENDVRVLGAHVEGPFIAPSKCGAQREDFIVEPTPALLNDLLDYADVIRIITVAPEVNGVLPAIEQLLARNIRVSGGHSDGTEFEARRAFERGMRQVTHTFNCMSSARHRGRERVAGLLEFALTEPEILCELIADGHHVSPTLMKLLYRTKGASGICLVTDSTAGAGLPNESHFSLGGHDCIVSDGKCLLADRSALAGSAAPMIDLIRTLVRATEVPLHQAVTMATTNPARALGLVDTKGCIKVGADADFAVFSKELEIAQTFAKGRRIYPIGS